jgi:hypothetical protein
VVVAVVVVVVCVGPTSCDELREERPDKRDEGRWKVAGRTAKIEREKRREGAKSQCVLCLPLFDVLHD